jgi:hypothetical protein
MLSSTRPTSITFRTKHRTKQKYGRELLSLSTVGERPARPARKSVTRWKGSLILDGEPRIGSSRIED